MLNMAKKERKEIETGRYQGLNMQIGIFSSCRWIVFSCDWMNDRMLMGRCGIAAHWMSRCIIPEEVYVANELHYSSSVLGTQSKADEIFNFRFTSSTLLITHSNSPIDISTSAACESQQTTINREDVLARRHKARVRVPLLFLAILFRTNRIHLDPGIGNTQSKPHF